MNVFVVIEKTGNNITEVKVFDLQSKMEDYMNTWEEKYGSATNLDRSLYWYIKEVE